MTPRPLIFISAVSRELKSARQLVANTLTFLGYQPVWQDIFGTETGDLRSLLREKIDKCKGVVQLVGQCYGVEPPTPDEEFGRVSYTQYEALYARKRGKRVWYLFIDEDFPADSCDDEPAELRELQAAYRRRLQADAHIFHPLASSEALEASVLKLRDDLGRLRRGIKRWAVGVVALLVFLSAATIWLVQMQRRQSSAIEKQGEQVTAIVNRYQKMEQALVRLADVEAQSKQPGAKISPEEQRAVAYATLERELGLPTGSLKKELPAFALELYNRGDTTPLMRARAAYALGKFEEAEKLSLDVAAQDRQAYETARHVQEEKRKQAIQDYLLAGQSAQKRIQYDDALKHFQEAVKLTDRNHSPQDWAEVQHGIGDLLVDQGHYDEAVNTLRSVVEVRARILGQENPQTLRSRNSLASALWNQGKYAEAEAALWKVIELEEKVLGPEHPETLSSRHRLAAVLGDQGKYAEEEAAIRQVLKLREKVLGPEHPDTLRSRGNLAGTLHDEGKYAEAEAQGRKVMKLQEKVLGPEHPDTLGSRGNLANTLDSEGKYAEAEAQDRQVVRLEEKVLGPEHPDTLGSRGNLASVLDEEGKYAEAETVFRELVKIYEKVLGPEHPDTLWTRSNLASVLGDEGKYAEAETENRQVIKLKEKVFGSEHSRTLESRSYLADTLIGEGKYAAAEGEFREVIKIYEKVVGSEHPDTLRACYYFASGLRRQNKFKEAKEFARRAAEGARKVLGPNHPNTRKYEKLLQEVEQNVPQAAGR